MPKDPNPFQDDPPTEQTRVLTDGRMRSIRQKKYCTLRVVAGQDMLRFASIEPGESVIIGRDERSDLMLSDTTVSKRHARVTAAHDGSLLLLDLGSTNGTRVNGQRVETSVVRAGDEVEVGEVLLRLESLSLDELAHLGRVLSRLQAADRDPLTGLRTRRFMDEQLPALAERCVEADVPFSCVFIDIDHFKRVNDRWGHDTGDRVLTAVAQIVMLEVRDSDPAVRYGGEEMTIFLAGSSEATAAVVADRIRLKTAQHAWERTATDMAITSSFGVAQRWPKEPLVEWLRRADAALYSAKNNGRNQVRRASQVH